MPYPRLQWLSVGAVYTQRSARSSIAQVSDRTGTASRTCFNFFRLPFPYLELQLSKTLVSITNCRFSSRGLCPQVFPRSCVQSTVTRWRCHTWICPTHFLRVVMSDSTSCQHVSCRIRLHAAFLVDNEHFAPHPVQVPALHSSLLLCELDAPLLNRSLAPWCFWLQSQIHAVPCSVRCASQRSRTQLSVCPTARAREFITLLAPCNMLVLVVHTRVAARLVATGHVAHGVRRLGAVLAESGPGREIGEFRCAATFAHALLASRRPYCKCCGVQFCTRVRNAGTRFCGVLQRERESKDHGACVVTGGWR